MPFVAVYALYLTGELVVPMIIAFLLKLVLQPAIEEPNFEIGESQGRRRQPAGERC